MVPTPDPPLCLHVVVGPPIPTIRIEAGKTVIVGRQSIADVVLPDPTVSRRHVQITTRAGTWLISDQGSRHGTYLNGVRLAPHEPTPVNEGDLVRIGPWTFHLAGPASTTPRLFATSDDLPMASSRVRRVPEAELSLRAQERLDLLIESAGSIAAAGSLEALANSALDAAVKGTGFPRAAFIRKLHGAEYSGDAPVEVVAARPSHGAAGHVEVPQFSRSLLRAADEGKVVRLDENEPAPNTTHSLIDLKIHSAICAPVMLDGACAAYLYLDARGTDRNSPKQGLIDAPAFCQALSKLCGLSLSNLIRVKLDSAHRELEADLKAAREAQRQLMPPSSADIGAFTYAVRSIPGRLVAGDLFDIIQLKDGKIGVFLGDVSGKGIGAAILMAGAQAHLAAALRHFEDPAIAMRSTNEYVANHCETGRFISLWVGVVDPRAGALTYVDAGHGHWLFRAPGEAPQRVACRGGLLCGVDLDAEYENEHLAFLPGSRLILYSDGVVEQRDASNEEFGLLRTVEALEQGLSCQSEVDQLTAAVAAYALQGISAAEAAPPKTTSRRQSVWGAGLADDVTVASIALR